MSFAQYRYYKIRTARAGTGTSWPTGDKRIKLVDAPPLDRRLAVVRLTVSFEDSVSFPTWVFFLGWTDNGLDYNRLGAPVAAGRNSIKFFDIDEIYWPLPAGRALYGCWTQAGKHPVQSDVYVEYIAEENQTGLPGTGG